MTQPGENIAGLRFFIIYMSYKSSRMLCYSQPFDHPLSSFDHPLSSGIPSSSSSSSSSSTNTLDQWSSIQFSICIPMTSLSGFIYVFFIFYLL